MEELWSFTVDPKRSQKRARFNLLTLEHGEYYFQVRNLCEGNLCRVVPRREISIFFVGMLRWVGVP